MGMYFQEIHLRKCSFKIVCMGKKSMHDIIPFWKTIHMEGHHRDGKNCL